MTLDSLTAIGTVTKPKGLSGGICLHLEDFVFDYLSEQSVPKHLFLKRKQQAKVLPYFIEKLDWEGQEVILQLEDVVTRNDAELLRGASLFIETEKISAYLSDNEEQEWDFLLQYTIIDSDDKVIGTVNDIFYLPASALAQVMINGKEVLIPLHENLVVLLDEQQKIIVIDMPEGLVDLYLHDNNVVIP